MHLHRPGRPTPGRDQEHRVSMTRATPPWICVDNSPCPQCTHESAPAVPMQTPIPTRKASTLMTLTALTQRAHRQRIASAIPMLHHNADNNTMHPACGTARVLWQTHDTRRTHGTTLPSHSRYHHKCWQPHCADSTRPREDAPPKHRAHCNRFPGLHA
ncbi:hypothetical protein [Xylella fastidiosa]|uniref:hypothetical protein n=2 Tax=Xylella fastidiosa TaxID=2371 RepID=UPI000165D901|nr:hypothetical protein [Xylella fastidiosa]ACA13125.1 hypothetical protein Xfasm12_2277 [Xylella fastidiosa M12]MBS9445178.1 hypothetical protein [Xylella fastidiosa subsp. multiplex]MBS9449084.1 hypothetical protein [Xylella fastidiosa subsp. multiplex]MBS9451196.1 hypothetical protein [Xylella fastidiosa subsp. multiplex]MBS9485303.1 hypothetical protein [Xylella fastidiosa subsp. multiplex]